MRIRDLLCHRSGLGLGEGDLMFWPHTTFTRDEVVYRVRFLKPATELSQPLRLQQSDVCYCRTIGGGKHRQDLGRLHAERIFRAVGNEQHEYQHHRVYP